MAFKTKNKSINKLTYSQEITVKYDRKQLQGVYWRFRAFCLTKI